MPSNALELESLFVRIYADGTSVFTRSMGEVNKATSAVKDQFSKLMSAAKDMGKELNKLPDIGNKIADSFKSATKGMGVALQRTAADLGKVKMEMSSVERAMEKVVQAQAKLQYQKAATYSRTQLDLAASGRAFASLPPKPPDPTLKYFPTTGKARKILEDLFSGRDTPAGVSQILAAHAGASGKMGTLDKASKIPFQEDRLFAAQATAEKNYVDAKRAAERAALVEDKAAKNDLFAAETQALKAYVIAKRAAERETAKLERESNLALQKEVAAARKFSLQEEKRLRKEMERSEGRAAKEAANEKKKAAKALEDAGEKMVNAARRVRLAILGFYAGVETAFVRLDDVLTRTIARMSDRGETTNRSGMQSSIINISGRSPIGSVDLAKGLDVLASSGMNTAMAMKSLGIAERFAVASGMDMKDATTALVQVQRMFGMESTNVAKNYANMTRIGDLFTHMASLTNTSIQELTESFGYDFVQATKKAGISLEEAMSLQMIYIKQGIPVSQANHMAARAIRELSIEVQKNKHIWTAAGISIFDARHKMLPLSQVLRNMQNGFSKLSYESQTALESLMGFQLRTQGSISPLMMMADEMDDFMKETTKATGSMEKMASAIEKSTKNQLLTLWGNIYNASLIIGEYFVPAIERAVKTVRILTAMFIELDPTAKKAVLIFLSITSALVVMLPLVVALGPAFKAVGVALLFIYANPIVAISVALVGFTISVIDWNAALRGSLITLTEIERVINNTGRAFGGWKAAAVAGRDIFNNDLDRALGRRTQAEWEKEHNRIVRDRDAALGAVAPKWEPPGERAANASNPHSAKFNMAAAALLGAGAAGPLAVLGMRKGLESLWPVLGPEARTRTMLNPLTRAGESLNISSRTEKGFTFGTGSSEKRMMFGGPAAVQMEAMQLQALRSIDKHMENLIQAARGKPQDFRQTQAPSILGR